MRRSHPGPAVYAIMWSKVAAVPVAPIRLLYSHVGIYSVYSYDGCGLDGVACYTKRSPTATVVGYCRVSTIEIVPPGGGPPGRRAVGVRTAEPLPVRCPRARPGGRRASSRLGAGRERVELEAAGHTTYQRERPSAPVGPLARCANARWPRSDSTSLFAGIRVGVNRACVRAPPRHLEPVPVQSDRHREWLRIDECERRPKMVSHTRAMR